MLVVPVVSNLVITGRSFRNARSFAFASATTPGTKSQCRGRSERPPVVDDPLSPEEDDTMVGELERTGSGRFETLGLIRGEAVGEEERRSRGRTELIVTLDGVKWDELMKLTAHEVCVVCGALLGCFPRATD